MRVCPICHDHPLPSDPDEVGWSSEGQDPGQLARFEGRIAQYRSLFANLPAFPHQPSAAWVSGFDIGFWQAFRVVAGAAIAGSCPVKALLVDYLAMSPMADERMELEARQ